MKVHFNNVCPPIPCRSYDWSCSLTDDEAAIRGWGATKREALNDLLESEDVDTIAKHFGIQVTFVDQCRGFEHGHWVAHTETSRTVESVWRECAIADLAFLLVEDAQCEAA
jgi:hypothetical protein